MAKGSLLVLNVYIVDFLLVSLWPWMAIAEEAIRALRKRTFCKSTPTLRMGKHKSDVVLDGYEALFP